MWKELHIFESYVVIDPKNIKEITEKEIISEDRYRQLVEKYGTNSFIAKWELKQ